MEKIIVTTTYNKKLSYLNNQKVFTSWGDLYSDKTISDHFKDICAGLFGVDGPGSFTYKPSGKMYKQVTFTAR